MGRKIQMKKLLLSISMLISISIYAQDDKTVTLVVSGQGKTQEEAKQNALRSSIEQAFGTFISSKTEILNDNLVKDEIVSVANGNIQKFEIISEVQIPNGLYATSLKATVSVTKLTSFVESKGFEVEFKGSLLGANLKQQRMNEDAEWKSILNLCEVSNKILSISLDYSIEVGEPVVAQNKKSLEAQSNDYQILFTVKSSPNNNFDKFVNYFKTSIKGIAMPDSEKEAYRKLNKQIYFLTDYSVDTFFFRSPKTVIALQNLFIKSNQYLHNFKVITNLDTLIVKTCCIGYDDPVYMGNGKSVRYVNTQNMLSKDKRYNPSEIWQLNSSFYKESEHRKPSNNNNPGYPLFNFFSGYYNDGSAVKLSSWRTYFEYLYHLRNNQILFDTNTYYTETGSFYIKNGESYMSKLPLRGVMPGAPYNNYPGIDVEIGAIKLEKIDYYCYYIAIYSEEEISKIKSISVKQLK